MGFTVDPSWWRETRSTPRRDPSPEWPNLPYEGKARSPVEPGFGGPLGGLAATPQDPPAPKDLKWWESSTRNEDPPCKEDEPDTPTGDVCE